MNEIDLPSSRSGHVAFDAFTRAYNSLTDHMNAKLDRRLFERIFIVYALVEYQLFMGTGGTFLNECSAFLPRNVFTELDDFILTYYDGFYREFALFWGGHHSFHPCKSTLDDGGACSSTIICDGHMKIRRRLCANPSSTHKMASYFAPVFEDFVVGCRRSPAVNSRLCRDCMNQGMRAPCRKKPLTKREKESMKKKVKQAQKRALNDMASVSEIVGDFNCLRC